MTGETPSAGSRRNADNDDLAGEGGPAGESARNLGLPRTTLVALSKEDCAAAARILRVFDYAFRTADGGVGECQADVLLHRARTIFAHRRRRQEIFGRGMFGEPAWEMLLLLFIARSANRYTVGQLARLSGSSRSSGFRWIAYLERQGWARREPHPTDLRLDYVELTEDGVRIVERYLDETL